MCFPFAGACTSLGREKMLIFNLCLVYQATLIALYWWPGIFLFAALLSANFTAMLFFLVDFWLKSWELDLFSHGSLLNTHPAVSAS